MKPLEFSCPSCSKAYSTNKHHLIGHKVECRNCGEVFRVGNKSDKIASIKKPHKKIEGSSSRELFTKQSLQADTPDRLDFFTNVEQQPSNRESKIETIAATIDEPIIDAELVSNEVESQNFVNVKTPIEPDIRLSHKRRGGIFRLLFVALGISIFLMVVAIAILSINRLPEKLQNYTILLDVPELTDPRSERPPSIHNLHSDRGPSIFESARKRKEIQEQNTFNGIMKRHPELFGLILIGISSIAFLRGFFGLATGRITGRLGQRYRGETAFNYSKFLIVVGGVIAMTGLGYILYWLLT